MNLVNAFKARKPWASVFLALLFGPIIGMLYLNRGKLALGYLSAVVAIAVLVFGFAHFIVFDAKSVWGLSGWFLQFAGAVHCFFVAKSKPDDEAVKWYARSYSLVLFILVPLVSVLAFRIFCYEPFYNPSKSMEPTLGLHDYFFVNKHAYDASHLPQRGDIVVFNVRKDGRKTAYVKRILGLPGDTIQLHDGLISINNADMPRRAVGNDAGAYTQFVEVLPEGKKINIFKGKNTPADSAMDHVPGTSGNAFYNVPLGQYFVVGDNRDWSQDSRNQLGYIPLGDIVGKATVIFWNEDTCRILYRAVE